MALHVAQSRQSGLRENDRVEQPRASSTPTAAEPPRWKTHIRVRLVRGVDG
jgi:hypothetical protein